MCIPGLVCQEARKRLQAGTHFRRLGKKDQASAPTVVIGSEVVVPTPEGVRLLISMWQASWEGKCEAAQM